MVTAYIIIFLSNILTLFSRKRNLVLVVISFAFFILIMGWSLSDPDWVGYYYLYNFTANGPILPEFGYQFLEKIFLSLGFDFPQFRIAIAFITYYLMYKGISFFIKKGPLSLFISSYALFSLFYDSIQLRNTLGISIIIIGLRYLFEEGKFDILKFIFTVLVATTFHTTMIFYLAFLIVKFKKTNLVQFCIILFTFLTTIIIVMNGTKIPYLEVIFGSLRESKYTGYLDKSMRWGFIFPLALQMINILFAKFLMTVNFSDINSIDNEGRKSQLLLNYKLNVSGILFIPIFTVNLNFYRLARNLLTINLIFSQLSLNHSVKQKERIKIILFTFIYVFVWVFYGFIFGNEFETVVRPLLENNGFFP
ncbi:EpsG family protein [Vagococcus sp. BWB3-3]|uniref:EpsG family protein n=1 Tax=Vagococcus allomyrinae TaxID=2794353 RepID=A0A940PIQ7_9ENTE|nr:EpsG family protein [Vagococcus allomyrinae]MBP1043643.1 EpsG family protein [Vagococcus allomyrinae]